MAFLLLSGDWFSDHNKIADNIVTKKDKQTNSTQYHLWQS